MLQWHHMMSLVKNVASNTLYQLLGRAFGAVATLIITYFLARGYGASGYGDFVKITTYVAFFYLLCDFGFNALYLQQKHTWTTLLALRVIGSIILMFLALGILACIPQGKNQGYTALVRFGIIIFAPSIFFQALIVSANALFQKHLRYDFSTIATIAGSIVTVMLMLIVTQVFVSAGVLFSIIVLLVGTAVTTMLGLIFARRLEKQSVIALSPMRSLFFSSIPLGLTLIFNLVYFHIDSVILTLTRTTAEVGIYGLAYKVFELPLVFPTFFMNALYPVMLNEVRDKKEGISKRFLSMVRYSAFFLLLISFCLSLVFWVAAPLLTLIKSDFTASIAPFRVLSLGFPVFFLSALTMWALIARKKQNYLVWIYGVSMIINVALNIVLVPTHGYMAAAWITLVSEGIVLLMSGFVLWKVI